ncbi:SGNH/GDSL hydrolase family protein [uncultured Ruminococcus sp.]|uniref:SGNH/GDSL hydrolase family protein n=1 Tax=uncultured Ruminococcus sp. TaxID=165186 RepID=UPI002601317E|nr:SGNH/GDSL hydrolase family protein [uncultured Ruminococcus sp.]
MKMKRFAAMLTACAMAICCMAGCAGGSESESSSGKADSSAAESSEAEKLPETDEEWNQAMLDKAMVSYGNTSMMQDVIKRAQAGEDVTIAYLGGSITEGISAGPDDCYAKLTYEHFAEKFGTGDNVKYHNAGLSGTPSKLGILRLDRDVLAYDPDVVFIEFAVNDGSEPDYQNAYESIVKTLLEKNIAVVLLFSVTAEDHSAQDYMKEIGTGYNLPMISYCDALRYLFANGRMKWEDFSDDQSHPNVEGHKLVASMVDYYFDTVMDVEPEGEYVMPMEDVYSPREVDAHMVENDGIEPIEMGSWEKGTDIATFTNGWTHQRDAGNDPIVFEIEAKFLYMIYKEVQAGSYGGLHVKVTADGEEYDDSVYEAVSPNGWGNAQVQNIAMMPEDTKYRVEISMADGDEETMGQILAFGYTS